MEKNKEVASDEELLAAMDKGTNLDDFISQYNADIEEESSKMMASTGFLTREFI